LLAFESLPIVLLGVDVAVAFYVLKYYEAAYRQHIERNRSTLQKVGMAQLDRLLQETRDQIMSGTFANSTTLQRGLGEVMALVNSQSNIRRYQSGVLFFLFLAAVASIWGSYAPSFVLWQTSQGPITLIFVALVLSTVVFLSCYLLLRRVRWFHERIPAETSSTSAS